jgi:two-component sensor histidine kinase
MLRANPVSTEFSLGLAHEIILASDTPLLLLGADTTVLAASRSFCRSFGIDPALAALAPLSSLSHGEWAVPQLEALLLATASGLAVVEDDEMELRRAGHPAQRLLIKAQKLNHSSAMGELVLLSVTDVTEARLRDRQRDVLLEEKAILLEELQHRMANSLQIIASVLRQSARTAKSDEARARINDAHHRVMSVAALQHQLAGSQLDLVDLRVYLISLCRSIGASMIRDASKLAIKVDVASMLVKAGVSLSLGLLVTELVINALKHAFPDDRGGTIAVGYRQAAEGWTLSVRDDGRGMLTEADGAKAGLGSSIVRALAAQLGAAVEVTSASPGTVVSIAHTTAEGSRPHPLMAAV